MSEFNSRLEWKRDHPDFEIKTFNRNHRIHFPNGALLEGSSAPDYSGDPEKNNPEQLFVASLSSCHMLTFLAVAALGKWKVDSYEDNAVGYLEKNESGKMSMKVYFIFRNKAILYFLSNLLGLIFNFFVLVGIGPF